MSLFPMTWADYGVLGLFFLIFAMLWKFMPRVR